MRKHKIHRQSRDITGESFGKLKAESYQFSKNEKQYWLFVCECGNQKTLRKDRVIGGALNSCGCDSKNTKFQKTHGVPNEDGTYRTWHGLKSRCLNPNHDDFHNYGGRGIKVCDRWLKFENFLADMGERPANRTIDRIDVNGDYCLKNCRWATKEQQCNNMRKNVFIAWNGKNQTIMQWSKELGLEYWEIRYFNKKGLDLGAIIARSKTLNFTKK
jgi:hypothetical protein